ncbi:MAG: sialate O-acetylesterase [Opitutales bacterium]
MTIKNTVLTLLFSFLTCLAVQAGPLKVFILAGQSNMQGHATIPTLQHLAMDPNYQYLLDKIENRDGSAKVYDKVQIAYLSGSGGKDNYKPIERKGALTAGYGATSGKIGPELTFGIKMFEELHEPILLIKTAWGGKSLNTDFRSPSAGDNPIEKRRDETGFFYRQMFEYVKKVLSDPSQYHPDYDANEGFEIAGFVWFQGFNDKVDKSAYPGNDRSIYTDLLAHFIRDVRKDFNAPDMPFVIGVIGTLGKVEDMRKIYDWKGIDKWFSDIEAFRKSMAAPAEMPEFKANVAAVYTENYLDPEIGWMEHAHKNYSKKLEGLSKEEKAAKMKEKFSERELEVLRVGKSNKGFHYFGSGKFFALVGEAFAEAMLEL